MQSNNPSKQEISAGFLALAAADLERAKRQRVQYVHLGREHGLTWGEIGAKLGMTDTAARMLAKRHPAK